MKAFLLPLNQGPAPLAPTSPVKGLSPAFSGALRAGSDFRIGRNTKPTPLVSPPITHADDGTETVWSGSPSNPEQETDVDS